MAWGRANLSLPSTNELLSEEIAKEALDILNQVRGSKHPAFARINEIVLASAPMAVKNTKRLRDWVSHELEKRRGFSRSCRSIF